MGVMELWGWTFALFAPQDDIRPAVTGWPRIPVGVGVALALVAIAAVVIGFTPQVLLSAFI